MALDERAVCRRGDLVASPTRKRAGIKCRRWYRNHEDIADVDLEGEPVLVEVDPKNDPRVCWPGSSFLTRLVGVSGFCPLVRR